VAAIVRFVGSCVGCSAKPRLLSPVRVRNGTRERERERERETDGTESTRTARRDDDDAWHVVDELGTGRNAAVALRRVDARILRHAIVRHARRRCATASPCTLEIPIHADFASSFATLGPVAKRMTLLLTSKALSPRPNAISSNG
jgi:hypothetical protein